MDSKIDKIIDIIRSLREEAPTMNLGAGQIAGTAEAGDDPPVRKRRRKYIYGGHGSRKTWIAHLKNGTNTL
jgi:hypothetical protein